MPTARLLDAEQLRERLHYDPDTGDFTWLKPHYSKPHLLGQKAGTISPKDGYVRIGLNGRSYLAHRLAWLYVTGEWPEELIDHRDVNGSNNSFTNLRAASHSENHANAGIKSSNSSGHKGVSRRWDGKKWIAYVNYHGRREYTEAFDTFEEACRAHEAAVSRIHKQFSRVS